MSDLTPAQQRDRAISLLGQAYACPSGAALIRPLWERFGRRRFKAIPDEECAALLAAAEQMFSRLQAYEDAGFEMTSRASRVALLEAAERVLALTPSGEMPEVLPTPRVLGGELRGGDAGHGGKTHVDFTCSESGCNQFTLVMPRKAWLALSAEPWLEEHDLVQVTLADSTGFNGPDTGVILGLNAQGDWEQMGLELALISAVAQMLRAHLKRATGP